MNNRSSNHNASSKRTDARQAGLMLSLFAAFILSLTLVGRAAAEKQWCPTDFKCFFSWLMTKDDATAQEQFVMGYLMANPLPIQWSHSMQEEIRRMYNAWAAPTGEAVD